MDGKQAGAWLDSPNGERIPIVGNCSIGRSIRSSVVLGAQKVSRRHAIINVQDVGEFWLIDLGSSNGTFLNKRRVHHPVRLCHLDQIAIGDIAFTFQQPEEITDQFRTTIAERTIRESAELPVWLLVADIEDFTPLSRSLVSEKLAILVGSWVSSCKEIIEQSNGLINKYLGDGFLAYWQAAENDAEDVTNALRALQRVQAQAKPKFRIALHFGKVAVGGMESMGEESLLGREVNFVFRMEKLAGSLGIGSLMSKVIRDKLGDRVTAIDVGSHAVKGFDGEYEFAGFEPPPL